MTIGQVLVLLDGEDLSECGVAARDLVNEQLHQITHGDDVDRFAGGGVLECLLCSVNRLGIVGVEWCGWCVRPLLRSPPGVERNQSAEADVSDVARRELCRDVVARSAVLPQELGDGEELFELDAARDVNAVHAQCSELTEQLLIGLSVGARRHAVEEDVAANHVNPKHFAVLQVGLGDVAHLLQLLSDHRMAGRIGSRQSAERGQTLEYGKRIEWGRERRCAHFARTSRAFRATCTRLGFQNLKRSDSSDFSTSASP